MDRITLGMKLMGLKSNYFSYALSDLPPIWNIQGVKNFFFLHEMLPRLLVVAELYTDRNSAWRCAVRNLISFI